MFCLPFLASKDAQEVMGVTHSVSESELADLTDATLVSEDTDEDDEDDEDDFAPSSDGRKVEEWKCTLNYLKHNDEDDKDDKR